MSSKIEWTEETWNPLIGCDKVSAGCKNCYAIQTAWIRMHNPVMAEKYAGTVEKTAGGQLNWTGQVNMHQPSLLKPLNTKKPTVFFVNSMSDLFHESVPFEFINAVFSVMSDCDQHIYQILTKRIERALEFFKWKNGTLPFPWLPKPNVWIGVSVEDQKTADQRIPLLLELPVAVRFLSCEPLIGALDLNNYLYNRYHMGGDRHMYNQVDWVICGGESGKDSRPMHPDWARSLRDQCAAAGVPFFFKQWGEYAPHMEAKTEASVIHNGIGYSMSKVGKKRAGRLLDSQLHNEYPIGKIVNNGKTV